MMNEFPDYKKSIFKQVPTKVTLFGNKQTRDELIAEQQRLKLLADHAKKGQKEEEKKLWLISCLWIA